MSEPELSADEIARHSARSDDLGTRVRPRPKVWHLDHRWCHLCGTDRTAPDHDAYCEGYTDNWKPQGIQTTDDLTALLRAVLVAHRVGIGVIDPLVKDLVAAVADHNAGVVA